jgi:L-ascorbate metabolism protein UlaG (beta-lactamase superfamily)
VRPGLLSLFEGLPKDSAAPERPAFSLILTSHCASENEEESSLSLTYLGHSSFKYELPGLRIYTDPYIQDPIGWQRLPKGDLVLLTHGHFDHGVLMSQKLFAAWKCHFVAPTKLIHWMLRKYKRTIPKEYLLPLDHGQTMTFNGVKILAVPAHHPMTRLGKTILHVFARSSAPGNPVNGYYFEGYYQSGDTVYTPDIQSSLSGKPVHTACLPIGGKYKIATPAEALRIAEDIHAKQIVPMHWQPLMEQVPFRYQPSHLVKLAKTTGTPVVVRPLAIGEVLEDAAVSEGSVSTVIG